MDNLIQVKAELLCFGLKFDDNAREFYNEQNPCKIEKTGNVGLHLLLDGKIPVIVSTTHKFDKKAYYNIIKKKGVWYLFKEKKSVCGIGLIRMPLWYDLKTSLGNAMPNVFLFEGLHFLHQSYQGCGFFLNNTQCKFCGAGKVMKIPKPREVAEVVLKAYVENPKIQVCLGGGTPLSKEKGTLYFLECIKEIRRICKEAPIWVEMIPPENLSLIGEMIEAGANSFGFNLEVWDDKIRAKICAGKSKTSKRQFLEAFSYVKNKLGPNKIGTVMIVGLEPLESLIKGIEELTKSGIRVCLLPFKPWDGSEFEKMEPCKTKDLIEVATVNAKLMDKYNIRPEENFGCLNCSGCTIEDDILKIERKK